LDGSSDIKIPQPTLEHVTKCCSHMATGGFLVKQPVRFEPLAYFQNWRILREYSMGE